MTKINDFNVPKIHAYILFTTTVSTTNNNKNKNKNKEMNK